MISDEEKAKFLARAKERALKYISVIEDIEGGKSESSSCRKHNIHLSSFRQFVRKIKSDDSEYNDLDSYDFLTWEDALYSEIFDSKSLTAPDDFAEAYAYVSNRYLTYRQRLILKLRFKEDLTLLEVANKLGVTSEAVRLSEVKALNILRHPNNAKVLYFGMSYLSELNRLRDEHLSKFNADLKNALAEGTSELYEFSGVEHLDIRFLKLSMPCYNRLQSVNINTIGDLKYYSDSYSLLDIKGMSQTKINEIKDALKVFNVYIQEM